MGFTKKLVDTLFTPIPLPSISLKWSSSSSTQKAGSLAGDIPPGWSRTTVPPGKTPKSIKNDADVAKLLMDSVNPGKPVYTDWTERKAIEDGLTVSGWVYAIVDCIATSIASVPWEVQKKISNNEWDKIDNHPVADLLANPNEYYTGVDMFGSLTQHLLLSGNALLLKVRDGTKKIKELWVISPDCIKPIPDENNYLLCYLYKSGSFEQIIPAEDIIHFKLDNPASRWWGMSPLKAAAKIVDTEVDAIEWWRWSLRNRAVKDGILQFKKPLSDPEFNLLKTQMIAQMTGSYNARLPLVIGSDSSFTPTSQSPVEMDFMKGRKVCRDDILAVYRMPLLMLGAIGEGMSYNNADKVGEQYWTTNIIPKLGKIAATLQLCLLGEFENKSKFRVHYDLSDVPALQAIFSTKVNQAVQLTQLGVPFNFTNTRLNLGYPVIEGMDFGWLPGTYLPFINNPDSKDLWDQETTLQAPAGQAVDGTGAQVIGGGQTSPAGQANPNSGGKKPKPTGSKPTKPGGRPPSNPTGSNGRGGKKEKQFYSPFAKKLILHKDSRDSNIRIEAAEEAIKSLFDYEEKMVRNSYNLHGEIGIKDALSYSEAHWKELLEIVWGDVEDSSLVLSDKLEHIQATSADELKYVTTSEDVSAVYNRFKENRAKLIAEDNILSARSLDLDNKARRAGKKKKTWTTCEDDRVRESHVDLDGITLEVGQKFPNGCMFPRDPDCKDLSETINCRCELVYHS